MAKLQGSFFSIAFLTSLSVLLGLSGCGTPARLEPIEGAANAPQLEDSGDLARIVLLGTNDIHGTLLPQKLKTREEDGGAPPVEYEAGGAAYLASYARILRARLGDKLLWLDGGDQFQGSIDSNLFEGAPMVRTFNDAGMRGATIGNHEFDYGPRDDASSPADKADLQGALKARIAEAHYPYISANIVEKKSGKIPDWNNFFPSRVFTAGKLKVGVIGLTTLETPTSTLADYVTNLKFTDLAAAAAREAKSLRDEGAQVIVATAHVGLKCESGRATSAHAIRRQEDPQGDCYPDGELVKFLKSLPKGTLDAVVAGHSHQVVHHWVAGVPVIQGGAFGRYFNLIYLTYDMAAKRIVQAETRIEGPIPVCPKVFRNQNDCNGDRPAPAGGRGKLVQGTFRGVPIEADPEVMKDLEPYLARSRDAKKVVIAEAARPLDHQRFQEAALGDLVADSIRDSVHADVGVMNSGGIRANIESGKFTYEDVFRTLPFENSVALLTLTGKELKTMLRIVESGSRGYWPISGVKVRVIHPESDARSSDLNHDGKVDLWEVDRLIEARFADGREIKDTAHYNVATIDFLVKGGDDLGWFMSQVPKERITINAGPLARDAFVNYVQAQFKAHGPLNSAAHPVVDPANPRIKFEKISKKDGKKKRRGHGKKRKKK